MITLGMSATASLVVDASNTALTLHSGSLPVLATPMMIALMEEAASSCLLPELADNQSTVGTQISVSHELASPIGARIRAEACVTAIDRRRIDFSVKAYNDDKLISQGTHSRFIVDTDKFLNKIKTDS